MLALLFPHLAINRELGAHETGEQKKYKDAWLSGFKVFGFELPRALGSAYYSGKDVFERTSE